MSKIIITIIVLVAVIIGGRLLFGHSGSPNKTALPAPTMETSPGAAPAASPADTTTILPTASPSETTATPTPAPSARLSVSIKNFAFNPSSLTVHKGTTVTWTNNDSASHTVTGNNGGPSSSSIGQGQSYSYTFNVLGTFPYHCGIHPSMLGSVQVIN